LPDCEKCRHCQQEILDGQRRYYSRQVGMKGHYHWDCFVQACKEKNDNSISCGKTARACTMSSQAYVPTIISPSHINLAPFNSLHNNKKGP